jgi:hypothetical protein
VSVNNRAQSYVHSIWVLIFLLLLAAACADPGVTNSTPESRAGSAGSAPSTATQTAATSASPGGATQGSCPPNFKCVDPVKAAPVGGITVEDAAGNPVPFACNDGKMALSQCDDANPAASCPGLVEPICLRVKVSGTMLTGCGQICTP